MNIEASESTLKSKSKQNRPFSSNCYIVENGGFPTQIFFIFFLSWPLLIFGFLKEISPPTQSKHPVTSFTSFSSLQTIKCPSSPWYKANINCFHMHFDAIFLHCYSYIINKVFDAYFMSSSAGLHLSKSLIYEAIDNKNVNNFRWCEHHLLLGHDSCSVWSGLLKPAAHFPGALI